MTVTLTLALVVSLLVELLAALTLIAMGARLRLASDRRIDVEAELALGSAAAEFRVIEATTLNGVPPGIITHLPPRTVAGNWHATAVAERPDSQQLVVLQVTVRRLDADGHLVAARQGTLLLHARTADTAIVIGHWPRF